MSRKRLVSKKKSPSYKKRKNSSTKKRSLKKRKYDGGKDDVFAYIYNVKFELKDNGDEYDHPDQPQPVLTGIFQGSNKELAESEVDRIVDKNFTTWIKSHLENTLICYKKDSNELKNDEDLKKDVSIEIKNNLSELTGYDEFNAVYGDANPFVAYIKGK